MVKKGGVLHELLDDIKGYRKQDITSKTIRKQIGSLDKRRKMDKKNSISKRKNHRKDVEWAVGQLKKLAISMTDFIYMTKKREQHISEVISTKERDLFKKITGISEKDFKKLCDMKLVKEDKLDQIVRDFYYQEIDSLSTEKFVGKKINQMAA